MKTPKPRTVNDLTDKEAKAILTRAVSSLKEQQKDPLSPVEQQVMREIAYGKSTKKYVNDNPKWQALAQKHDNLKYILITYGKTFSTELLKATQKEFKSAERSIERLEKKLSDAGYWFK